MGGRLRDGRAVVPDVASIPAESRLRTRPARGTTKRKHELSKMRRGHRAATGQSGLGSVGPAHIGGTERGHEPRPAEGDQAHEAQVAPPTAPARGTTKRKQNEAIHSPIPETRRKREVRLRLESVTHPHSPVRGGGSETRRDTKHRTETSIGSRCGDKRTQDPVERANNTCRYC